MVRHEDLELTIRKEKVYTQGPEEQEVPYWSLVVWDLALG